MATMPTRQRKPRKPAKLSRLHKPDSLSLEAWQAGLRRDEVVLDHLDKGVAVLDPAGTVTWANPALRGLCPDDPVGRPLTDALGAQTLATEDPDPLAAARGGRKRRKVPSGCARRSAIARMTAGLWPSPQWLPLTSMFSARGRSASMHRCQRATPSVRL